jgi:hypothetical protein
MTQTIQEKSIELSLHPLDLSGRATEYIAEKIQIAELQKTLTSHNYSPIIWRENRRLATNFAYATAFCMDIDEGMTIGEAERILEKEELNYALITTKSHRPEAQRFRILIPFAARIYTYEKYRKAAGAIDALFGRVCDPAVFDGARQYFASPESAYYSVSWGAKDFDVTQFTTINLRAIDGQSGSWDDSLIVRLSGGEECPVEEITQKTPIYCPWHADESPSAFIDYSEKSENWYIHCSACNATFWKSKSIQPMAERARDFWSHSSKIYEMGIIGDYYHFKEIGEKKFHAFIGAQEAKEKQAAYEWLVKHHHISNIITIDYIGNPMATSHTFQVEADNGRIEVRFAPLSVELRDNQFIEDYLERAFGPHKDFIKEYLAVYAYTDFRKLPTLILVGKRGVGKNIFAEMVAEIYPQRSQFWSTEESNFTPEFTKKLLIADETISHSKKDYLKLKRLSGQASLPVNEKFTPQYQVKNNVNIIILSNSLLPIFVEREELPTSEANNQFFVFEMQPFSAPIDAQLGSKLKARLGHYVRTELKRIFDALDLAKYRYSIPVPITPEEQRLFKSSVSIEQMNTDRFIQECVKRYSEYADFLIEGHLTIEKLCDDLQMKKTEKREIVRNLRERCLIADAEPMRIMIAGRREYCYRMTDTLKNQIQLDVKIGCFAQSGEEEQAKKAA